MKRIVITLALVALALPVAAQEVEDFAIGEINLGLWQRDTPASSKFLEYRDIPQGAAANFFQFKGRKGDYNYDFYGSGVTQKDQKYYGRFETPGWKFEASYVGVPHSFGNGGRSILNQTDARDGTEWRMSDTLQATIQTQIEGLPARNYDTVLPLVQPTLDAEPANIDLRLQRNRTSLAFSLFPGEGNFDVSVTYLHERRTGTRAANGTAFGFNNVIETPEPLKYITQDFGVNATFRGAWGNVFAGFNFNDFENKYDTFAWDNPFRGTDSTDGRAYLGPYTTVNGPKTGLMALAPSNEAWTFKAGTNLKFGPSTRLRADGQIGQWTQNEQDFIGWTTNTAVETPGPVPANNLDGKIDVLALNGYFTTKFTDALRFNARYRLYENENKTPRISFDGYVRFDAVWEEIPRISVPNGFSSNLFDAYVTYDLGRILGLEAGWKYNKIRRDFRESEHTTENMFRLAADARFGIGVVRAIYEFGDRSYDEYLPVEGEEHSFLAPGQPANNTALRRYDQNERDRNRFGVQAQISPGSGLVTVSASYFYNKDEYANGLVSCNADFHDGDVGDSAETCAGGQTETLGLEEAEYTTFNLDADFTPTENFSVYGFYTREDMMSLQDGIQSGGSLTFSDAARWASSIDTTVDSFGAGARWAFVPDTWMASLFYRYQKADGNNSFTGGANYDDLEAISGYDDTTLNFFSAKLKWNCNESWALGGGAFWEKYEFDDAQTQQLLNYMPGSFFLVANNFGYDSWAGWLSLTYSFQ
jgi:MtrB/PioB family decaheme-associated outer membrane protein